MSLLVCILACACSGVLGFYIGVTYAGLVQQ
jgi:hypothetical protein